MFLDKRGVIGKKKKNTVINVTVYGVSALVKKKKDDVVRRGNPKRSKEDGIDLPREKYASSKEDI